jgi:hypothetical protein
VRHHRFTVACVASVLACVLAPAAASAGIGDISTFAGSPVFGPVSATSIGAGGGTTGDIATATLDGTTYVYYAGAGQNVVRRIDLATDQEQVVAGNGGYGAPVEGSPATATTVGPADGIALDASGDMAILAEAQRVLFVPAASGTYFDIAMTAGDIYTLPVAAQAIALSPQGNLAYSYDGLISFVSIASGTRTALSVAGSINNQAVAIDAAGDIAFLGPNGAEVEIVPASSSDAYTGSSAKGSYYGISMPSAGTGYALVDECDDDNCGANPGNGGYGPDATVSSPSSLAFDSADDLVTGESGVYGARFVPATAGTYYGQAMSAGDIYAIGGQGAGAVANGATATSVAFVPIGVSIDSNGDLLADAGLNGLLRISGASDAIETVAGDGSYGYDGDGIEGATAQFGGVGWVTSDAGGNVAILESADSRVRFIPALSGTYFGQSMTGGDIYTVAGDGIPLSIGSSGIGGPATAAKFDTFQYGGGIALDANGDLAIADPGNSRICFVPARSGEYYGQAMTAGDVYTVGGSLDGTDAAFDAAGDMFVADSSVQELVAGTSTPTTLPGSTGTEAHDIAVDAQGDVAVTAFNRDTVTLIPAQSGAYFGQSGLTAGTATTIAGNGTEGYSGDGAAATSAELDTPVGLAFDPAGDLVIAQEGGEEPPRHHHDAVRFLPRSSGTFYGQSMSVGDIYTIAGDGKSGFLGDGGPGTAAELAEPSSVATMPGEDVLIADQGNNRVRVVSGSVPTATTGAAGTATAVSDTVNGSVNPQGRPIGYHFEYGTTTAYEASQPVPDQSVGSDHAEHPESQTLESLTPGTTYHYRIVATYDEAGATISLPGADATFTTERLPISVLGNSGAGSTESTSSGSQVTGVVVLAQGTSPGVASNPKAIEQLLNGCSGSPVVLNDVYIQGGHVEISGGAAKSLIGKKVKILFNEGKPVATATVGANGQYATTAPLPPAKIRDNPTTRYTAEIGKLRSLHLKLLRRLLLEPVKASGTTVTLTGQVTPPLTKPIAPVTVEQQLECGKPIAVKTFTPSASGRFNITVTVPANAKAAIFRLTTKVAANKHSVAHGFTTFSLPLPVALG